MMQGTCAYSRTYVYTKTNSGSAIIFEFRHFKKEKSKISVKCWAFLEREELKPGEHVLELYKKPVDLKRKKLSLFTVKPLYLHLDMAIDEPKK
jgi:hypothetical protein